MPMPQPRRLEPGLLATLLFLSAALLLGGSSAAAPGTDVVRLASIPVMLIALWRLRELPPSAEAWWPLGIFAAAVALTIAQLIPLPPALWTHFPGRQTVLDGFRAAAIAPPWAPLSLTPDATFAGLLGFLPPAAMFLAVLTTDGLGRRALLATVLVIGVLAVIAGMMQMATGPSGPFRPYVVTNLDSAVGFFANRNHQAAFLLCAVPLAAYWAVRPAGGGGQQSAFLAAVAVALFTVLVVSLGLTRSRAGVILLAPALAGSALVAVRRRTGAYTLVSPAILTAAGLTGVALVGLFAFTPIANRFHAELDQDLRVRLTPVVAQAAMAYSPPGSGLGSFETVYRTIERPPAMVADYVNHAHDDYLETWLEFGWPGLAIMAGFIAWWLVRSIGIARRRDGAASMAMAGAVMVGILMAHSIVDYPLRTPALATLFALGCGLMIAPPERRGPSRGPAIKRPGEPTDR
ncbi:MAG TPA: O-antigen ligase family protein [Caulobacteraceae bacterium]|jgi:O-antigen ligase|nr:O-antigen ligase family protein [Caulobacteraceae bacterium]